MSINNNRLAEKHYDNFSNFVTESISIKSIKFPLTIGCVVCSLPFKHLGINYHLIIDMPFSAEQFLCLFTPAVFREALFVTSKNIGVKDSIKLTLLAEIIEFV